MLGHLWYAYDLNPTWWRMRVCMLQVAAQNCWVGTGGAFTGEVSAEQLHDMAIPWVIVGHSERRALLAESNDFIGHKAAYALSQVTPSGVSSRFTFRVCCCD